MSHRDTISAAIAVAALLAAALCGQAAAAGLSPAAKRQPAVVRGIVTSIDSPSSCILEDGTRVELEGRVGWDGSPGIQDLAPGDEIAVIGKRLEAGGSVVIKAGGVRIVSPNARVAPVGALVCVPSRLSAAGVKTKPLMPSAETRAPGRSLLDNAQGEVELEGAVVSVAADSFGLESAEAARYTVVVDAATELRDFTSLSELRQGDTVRARGELDGSVLYATRVELRAVAGGYDGGGSSGGGGSGSDDGGVEFESTGLLTELLPPDSFAFSDQRVYRVDGETDFDQPIASYAGLEVGQYLEVKATYEGGGAYRAVRIKYEGEQDNGQGFRVVEGTIDTVSSVGLTLTDATELYFSTTTVFDGDADRREDLRVGWDVEAYVLLNSTGQLLALSVRARDPAPSTTEGQEYEPHEAVLVLTEGADPQTVASRHDADVAGEVSSLGWLFEFEQEIDDDLLTELTEDPDVVAVEPNFLFRDPESTRRRFVIVDRSPTSGEYTEQWAAIQHGVTKAHTVSRGDGTVVAVMDTGVEFCHPLLLGHLAAGGLDLVDGDMSPWETADGIDQDGDGEVDEAAGHGTFVASVVALAAPGARIVPYRVLDDDGGGTAFDLALALADAIERGVDVINLSLAYRERSVVVDLLLEEAAQRGIVVVAAAGNDGSTELPFPALDSHVLAVTALRADGAGLADFANRSDKATLAAIGEDVYGALYGGQFGTSSGTSMAAPFAAAGAALVKSLDPGISPEIVRQLLRQTGVVIADGARDVASLDLGRAATAAQP